MIQPQQDGPDLGKMRDVSDVKRPISARKVQANRANAKRSTGPRTAAGKAVSRRNALRHGILSRSIDLPPTIPSIDRSLLKSAGLLMAGRLTDSGTPDMACIWEKMARVLALEKDCMQRADGLEQNGRLLHRYERMLTRQLHTCIRELGGLAAQKRKDSGRNS